VSAKRVDDRTPWSKNNTINAIIGSLTFSSLADVKQEFLRGMLERLTHRTLRSIYKEINDDALSSKHYRFTD